MTTISHVLIVFRARGRL